MAEHPDPLEKKLAFYESVNLEKKAKLENFEKEDKQNKQKLLNLLNSLATAKPKQKKEFSEKFISAAKENLDLASKWCDVFKEERDSLNSYRNRFMKVLQRQMTQDKSLRDSCVIPDNLRSCKLIPFTADSAPHHPWETEKEGKKEPAVIFSADPKASEKWHIVAQGNSSNVYKAIFFGTQTSVKVLKGKVDSEILEKFKHEVHNLRKISHPHVLRVYGAVIADGDSTLPLPDVTSNVAIVQEYIPKRTLSSILFPPANVPGTKVENLVSFSIHRKADILKQIVEAMHHLHQNNVIHGNLNTRNVLLDEDFNVKITDFGLGSLQKLNTDEISQDSSLLFKAPEIFSDSTPSKPADIYSFAVVAWELFSEKRIFEGYELANQNINPKSKLEVLNAAKKNFAEKWINEFKNNNKRPSTEELQKIPAVVHVITSAWAQDPAQRPTFEALEKEKPWQKIHAEVHALSQNIAKKFWESLEKRPETNDIEWEKFAQDFAKSFGVTSIFHDHGKYREALKSAIDLKFTPDPKDAKKTLRLVSKENWERVASWFDFSNGPHLTASVYSLLTNPYFFGTTSKADAHKKLEKQHPGTYLVRYEDGHWILSYVDNSKEIKDKALEIQGSVALTISKALHDNSIFPSKISARPCPDQPALYANIDSISQQRGKGAYTYSIGSDSTTNKPQSGQFEGQLLSSAYQPGQTFLA